jgi:hypothetical protein
MNTYRYCTLQWAKANGCHWDEQSTCSAAARRGDLDLLQWGQSQRVSLALLHDMHCSSPATRICIFCSGRQPTGALGTTRLATRRPHSDHSISCSGQEPMAVLEMWHSAWPLHVIIRKSLNGSMGTVGCEKHIT